MNRSLLIFALAIAVSAMIACGDGEGEQDINVGYDVIFPDFGPQQDTVIPEDAGQEVMSDVEAETEIAQLDTAPETAEDIVVEVIDAVDTTEPPPDVNETIEDTGPVYNFCNAISDCQPYEVCDMATGVCEERSSYKMIVGNEDLFQFKPLEGAYGDFIVLDGSRFLTSVTVTTVRADIGGSLIAGSSTPHSTISPHRIQGVVPNSASGKVGVVFQDASPIYQKYPVEFTAGVTGVVECDGTTPAASDKNGTLGEVGPYAAGYVDIVDKDMRVYYPASCGSVRRPGIEGTYPMVVVLAESQDFNFPFLNFDYIGQMLATWGIVTVSMDAKIGDEDAELAAKTVLERIPSMVNADMGALHAAMTGVNTSGTFAWLVFGTGSETLNILAAKDTEKTIYDKATAAIAIAPGSKLNNCGADYFMTLFGPKDGIASNNFASNSYDAFSSPKWKVQILGGNHSLFTDHQMYYGGGYIPVNDGEPEIMRKEQMYETLAMILPFLQLAFGLDQPFSSQVNTSFSNTKVTVTKG